MYTIHAYAWCLKAFSLNNDLIFTLFLAQRLQKTWNNALVVLTTFMVTFMLVVSFFESQSPLPPLYGKERHQK